MNADEIWEEIICDSLGDMNIFAPVELLGEMNSEFLSNLKEEVKKDAKSERGPPINAAKAKFSIEIEPISDNLFVAVEKASVSNLMQYPGDSVSAKVRSFMKQYRGTVLPLGSTDKAYMRREAEGEYTNPAKLVSEDAYTGKLNAASELRNLLKAATFVRHDNDNGRHPDATRGWNYYKINYVVPVNDSEIRAYSGEIQIKLIDRGDCFYDITKIEDITNGSAGQALIKAAGSVYDVSNNSIPQKSDLSTESEKKVPPGKASREIEAEYSDYNKPITISNIETLRSIGRKSINKFTDEDIAVEEFYQDWKHPNNKRFHNLRYVQKIADIPTKKVAKNPEGRQDYEESRAVSFVENLATTYSIADLYEFVNRIEEKSFHRQGVERGLTTGRRFYNLRGIRIEPAGGQLGNVSSSSRPDASSINSIVDLYEFVKTKIKKTEVLGRGNTENGVTQQPRSVNISIAEIFKKINPSDKIFLKHILEGFLDEKQKAYKKAAQEGREAISSYRNQRTKTETRHAIKKVVNELNQYRLNGTKEHREPSSVSFFFSLPFDLFRHADICYQQRRFVSKDYERYVTMYKDNDTMIPRDRISDDMLRRMLDEDDLPMMPPSLNTMPTQKQTWGLEGYPLASVYAPRQSFHKLYDKDAALSKGTLFVELDLPFMGESIANKGGTCRG